MTAWEINRWHENITFQGVQHWEKRRNQNSALWEPFWKMVPFYKKGTKTIPFWKSAPRQKGTVFQNSALRAPFSTKRLKMVPSWKKGTVFAAKKGRKWCPFFKGAPFWCPWKKGHHFRHKVKGYYFCREKIGRISALLQKGTKIVPQRALFYGPSNGALRVPFRYRLFFSVNFSISRWGDFLQAYTSLLYAMFSI